jgi:hypothetical protein
MAVMHTESPNSNLEARLTPKKQVKVKLEHYDEKLVEYNTTTTKRLRHNDG